MSSKRTLKRNKQSLILSLLIYFVILPLLFFVGILVFIIEIFVFLHFTIKAAILSVLVLLKWRTKGKYGVFVYSNSKKWKEYVEEKYIPIIAQHCFIINWSDYKWRADTIIAKTLGWKVFCHWTGIGSSLFHKTKNNHGKYWLPVAIIFKPWFMPKVLYLGDAIKEFNQGITKPLTEIEEKMFELLMIKPQ